MTSTMTVSRPQEMTKPSGRLVVSSKTLLLVGGFLAAITLAILILTWDLPTTSGRAIAVGMRWVSVGTIAIVACTQAVGTVLFHTVTQNRILTPSIMGFEAIYVVIQTALVFFFGGAMLASTDGLLKVALQSALMVAFATVLFVWLFLGKRADLQVMLLVGVVLGVGLRSLATFLQRLLTPSDFDILSAKLFGNISNSNAAYLPWAAVIALGIAFWAWRRHRLLDVLSLGPDMATNLGLRYRKEVVKVLIAVAVLISVSTSLVGPMAFYGFIVATLTYQFLGTSHHRFTLPFSVALGMVVLFLGYFVLKHVFSAAGMLSVIIEFGGGIMFLVYLLRKGSL